MRRILSEISRAPTCMPVLLAIGVVVVLALQLPRSVSSAKQVQPLQVTDLRVSHKAGQSFITWREVGGPSMGPAPIAEQVEKLRAQSGSVQYRVYRSTAPITTLDRATPIAELPQLSGWNTAHEGRRANAVARRYVVRDGEAPLSLDHGVFVFNPATAGEGVLCRRGSRAAARSSGRISAANATAVPVHETVGRGEPSPPAAR